MLVGISFAPRVAICVLWFGAETVAAILMAKIARIIPIVANVPTGIAKVEPDLGDVMRALKPNTRKTLWNVGLPRSMPYFFAFLEMLITLSIIGSVIAETVALNKRVGNLTLIAASSFIVPLIFAGLMILALMGGAFDAILSLADRQVASWALRKNS